MMIRAYEERDIPSMTAIWNQVVREGLSFPRKELPDEKSGPDFFKEQSYNGVLADDEGLVRGLYILHPNNVGRCAHIANASYAVEKSCRWQGYGRALVEDSLRQAKRLGFVILQFNAVVETNLTAGRLYENLGFRQLGVIPKGFQKKDGSYENICPYYYEL